MLVDLDDTILAFDAVSDQVWLDLWEQYIDRLPGWTVRQLFDGMNAYRQWFWSDPDRHRKGRLEGSNVQHQIVLGAFRQMEIDAPELGRRIGDDYARERTERVRPFPGAIETLTALKKAGVRLAMITNGSTASQRAKIERFDLARFFDFILVEEEFGVGKPDARVYVEAMRQLATEPSETWIIGDNLEWEVAAPQRLGIFAIWNDHRGSGLPEGSPIRPDRIVNSLRDIFPPGSLSLKGH